MIGANSRARHGGGTFGAQEDSRIGTCLVQDDDILRKCYRNSAQGGDCFGNLAASLEDVANDKYDREAKALSRTAAEGHACNKSVGVHAIETSTPWALALGNHFAAEPTRRLEVIGHDVEWIVVVAYKRRAVSAKPDRLRASVQKRRWSELAEYLSCKIVFADEGAHPLIRAEQFRHVPSELCCALGCRRRRSSSGASIPSFGFGAACDEALPPRVAWGVLAYRDEALLHVRILPKLLCEVRRHVPLTYRAFLRWSVWP